MSNEAGGTQTREVSSSASGQWSLDDQDAGGKEKAGGRARQGPGSQLARAISG